MPDRIVEFSSPPVVEVVAAVAFNGLSSDQAPFLASFWKDRLRANFPVVQNQGRYEPTLEQFEEGAFAPNSFTFNIGSPPPRLWALSDDGQRLLQLQHDWFACNWRKVQPHDEYDRWTNRRAAFQESFGDFIRYLQTEQVGLVKITQTEVTYINHIRVGKSPADLSRFADIFAVLPGNLSNTAEQLNVNAQFKFRSADDLPGRLRVTINPGMAPDGTFLYNFELVARGQVADGGLDGAMTSLDSGREAIDRAFVELTTDKMHTEWGRTL